MEQNLRKQAFGALEALGRALVDREENGLGEGDFPVVYEKSLVFLFRLLFVLFAENRNLLPIPEDGPGANRRHRREFPPARLSGRLRGHAGARDHTCCSLYEGLQRLFSTVNGTFPRQSGASAKARYRGGLFDPALAPELEHWRIGDAALADVLRQLIFVQPPARARRRQGQVTTGEAIDYSSLAVRELGDIYEGLLGTRFEREKGRLVLRAAAGPKHRRGTFYTPDRIVQFLVRETLGPILEAVGNSDAVQRALSAASGAPRRDNSSASALLRLKLVDPAMGSGHFLVHATEWLAQKIMDHPTTRPVVVPAAEQGPEVRGAETACWRQRVAQSCIHGVDINPMAVELARLSLTFRASVRTVSGSQPLEADVKCPKPK